MSEILLTVEKSYPNDSGRGIARLDPDALLHLNLSPGDIIEINGFTPTLAKTWRADREDWNTDTIRIDGFIRNNAGVRVGQQVRISKATVETAGTLTLAPPPEANVQFGKDAAGMVKRQILKRPISKWDIVPVMSSTNHPFMRSPGQAIPLVATQIEPGDSVLITEDTDVLLTERIELDDDGVSNAIYPERPEQDPQFQVKLESQRVPSDKCGHQKISKPIVPDDEGNLCCARRVWREGRCVWHSNVDKSSEDSEPVATTKPVDRSESRQGESDSIGRSSVPSFEDLSFQEAVLESRNSHAERLDAVQLNGAKVPESVSFDGCFIAVAQFQGAELTNVDFSAAKIWHSDLSEANLRDAVFEEAIFKHSHLDRAEIVESNLSETKFIGTQLVETDLSGSQLRGTVFEECQAVGSDFSEVIMRDVTLSDSNLNSSDFSGAELQNSKLKQCNLSDIDFSDADLRGADFNSSDVAGAKLSGAINLSRSGIADARNLSEAEWAGANLHGIDFTRRDLSNAGLEEAQLREGVLRDTDLSDANLCNANLSGAKLQCANLSGADLKGADLTNADLRFATLQNSELAGANLTGANLSDAQLSKAELMDTVLEETCLIEANLSDTDLTDANARSANLSDSVLEQALLARTDLRGADLVNARLYQTLFPDTRIDDRTDFGQRSVYESGVSPSNSDVASEEAATWVYRRLEGLHDENAMADRARTLHFRKEEIQRAARLRAGQYSRWLVDTINRWLTGHGESLRNVISASIVVIILCGLMYPFTGGITRGGTDGTTLQLESVSQLLTPSGLNVLIESMYFSVITFTTVGYGDLFPASLGTKILVGVESLLGALFIALFVFVLGRRVSR